MTKKIEFPLVLLHGFLGSKEDWSDVASYLPIQSIPLDLENFPHATQSLPPFDLVGYSMGGRVALQFAAKHPERVRRLILLSAHLGLENEEEKKKRIESDEAQAHQLREDVAQFLKLWYDQPLFASLKQRRDIVQERMKVDPERAARMLVAMSLGKQDNYWNKIPKNTSFILGELDQKYRNLYANIPHHLVLGAGHAMHLEEPKRTAQAILECLS